MSPKSKTDTEKQVPKTKGTATTPKSVFTTTSPRGKVSINKGITNEDEKLAPSSPAGMILTSKGLTEDKKLVLSSVIQKKSGAVAKPEKESMKPPPILSLECFSPQLNPRRFFSEKSFCQQLFRCFPR